MATDRIHIDASPRRVFAVLATPASYGHWVVGTREVCDPDADWPQPGSSFRYVAGIGPARVTDRTTVVAADPPRRLELLARAGPLPDATIVLDLAPQRGGTCVTLHERPARRLLALAMGPLGHFALSRRNQVALGRLKRLAERGATA